MKRLFLCSTALFVAAGSNIYAQRHQAMQGPTTPLATLVAEAQSNNAQVLSAEHGWKASAYRAPQAAALPDPQITVQDFSVGSPKPWAGFSNSDFAYVGIGVSQDLPYPGKLRLRETVAELQADAQKAQIDVVRINVADQVKTAYLRLAYLHQTIDLLDRNSKVLETLIQDEVSRYSVGQGSQADILRGQLEHTKLLRETTMHEQETGQLESTLKVLLHRAQDSADIIPEPLRETESPLPLADRLPLVASQNALLKADQTTVQQQAARLKSTTRGTKPDFSVGYMVQLTGSSYRDYYVATFNVRFPRKKRVNGEIAEAAEMLEQSKADADADGQQQFAETRKESIATQSSAELMKEYKQGLIPQAESVFQSELTAYESNRGTLSSVLTALMDRIAFEHDYQQALLDHEVALAHLETLTGVGLQ